MRIIKIDRCGEQCPYFNQGIKYGCIAYGYSKDRLSIRLNYDVFDDFPDFCELEKVKKDEYGCPHKKYITCDFLKPCATCDIFLKNQIAN